jgi:hypothetical protein
MIREEDLKLVADRKPGRPRKGQNKEAMEKKGKGEKA